MMRYLLVYIYIYKSKTSFLGSRMQVFEHVKELLDSSRSV